MRLITIRLAFIIVAQKETYLNKDVFTTTRDDIALYFDFLLKKP